MPVRGESRPATARTSGSRRITSAPSTSARPGAPFALPFASRSSSTRTSASFVATITLPNWRCGMPSRAQRSYSRSRPSTQSCAFEEPAG